ncbi:hypothetical protein [Microlunatus flavus]|uniref:Uncharacterized protein n=1 Tax=Microlunatus flavus TaxID=1036181 RepID=A0A1H9GEU6_9ACTN|nr:hypothetical protein [Microlunatus flavus]SEQ48616.1 hypothetical protein SAMN05421756_103608 [Microlunatus flavus]
MNILLSVALTTLVVTGTLRGLLRFLEHLDRADADPVGRVRLTTGERWLIADLERRWEHPAPQHGRRRSRARPQPEPEPGPRP